MSTPTSGPGSDKTRIIVGREEEAFAYDDKGAVRVNRKPKLIPVAPPPRPGPPPPRGPPPPPVRGPGGAGDRVNLKKRRRLEALPAVDHGGHGHTALSS